MLYPALDDCRRGVVRPGRNGGDPSPQAPVVLAIWPTVGCDLEQFHVVIASHDAQSRSRPGNGVVVESRALLDVVVNRNRQMQVGRRAMKGGRHVDAQSTQVTVLVRREEQTVHRS